MDQAATTIQNYYIGFASPEVEAWIVADWEPIRLPKIADFPRLSCSENASLAKHAEGLFPLTALRTFSSVMTGTTGIRVATSSLIRNDRSLQFTVRRAARDIPRVIHTAKVSAADFARSREWEMSSLSCAAPSLVSVGNRIGKPCRVRIATAPVSWGVSDERHAERSSLQSGPG